MVDSPLHDAAHWRRRAEEMRAYQHGVIAREVILKIAHDYDRLARRADERKPIR
jgi:hypothetical protein